jgi:predicted secreted Zn-dependent protease
MDIGIKRFLCVAAALVSAGYSIAWAEPEIKEKDEQYDIHGNTMAQLFSEMHHKGGRSNGVAWCSWNIEWDPEYAKTPNGYVVTKPKTKIVITYRYPRWTDQDKAPEKLKKEWDALLQNAMVHEKGHGAIAKEAARAIDDALMTVPPHPDIRIYSGRVSAMGNKVLNAYKNKEQEYDKLTNFGRKQELADKLDHSVHFGRDGRP